MSTTLEEPQDDGTLPGMPTPPQFEGKPVVRYRANLSGISNFQAPGPLEHGDRGRIVVTFNIKDVRHPRAENEKDGQGSLLGRRLMRSHDLAAIEAEFIVIEDEHGNPVSFNDGKREVG